MTLLKQTRVKIIVLAVAIIMIFVTAIIVQSIYVVTKKLNTETYSYLEMMAENDGETVSLEVFFRKYNSTGFPVISQLPPLVFGKRKPVLEKSDFRSYSLKNAKSIKIEKDFSKYEFITGAENQYTDQELKKFIEEVFKADKEKGLIDDFYFLITEKQNCFLLCFVNRIGEVKTLHDFYISAAGVIIFAFIFAFVISFYFSKLLMHPIEVMIQTQKQFISDSSHELRTPLSVIETNLSVLEDEIPDNKWLTYIKEETDRMSKLVKDLLYLSKTDQNRLNIRPEDFDLAAAVENSVLPFESMIYEQKKSLELDLQPGIKVFADQDFIKEIVRILVDNAVKYSEKGSVIRVSLGGQKEQSVKVYNTGSFIKKENLNKVFERFFREDNARTSDGGTGLGLSIAQALANVCKASLTADSDGVSWVEFTLKLR